MGQKIRLKVLKPRTHEPETVSAAVRGDGDLDFICGDCYAVMFEGVEYNQLIGGDWRCASCGAICEPPRPVAAG